MGALLSLAGSKILGAIIAGAAPTIGSAVFGFITKSRLTVYLCLACAIAGAAGGWYVTMKFWQASEVAEVRAALAQTQVAVHVVTKTETVVQTRIQKVREKGEVIIREVPVLVTQQVEKACPGGLPVGFVRLHDAAAENEPAGSPADTDDHPAGVTLAEAGSVIAHNYTEYHACREQVIGWNTFYACLRSSGSMSAADGCFEKSTSLMQRLRR